MPSRSIAEQVRDCAPFADRALSGLLYDGPELVGVRIALPGDRCARTFLLQARVLPGDDPSQVTGVSHVELAEAVDAAWAAGLC